MMMDEELLTIAVVVLIEHTTPREMRGPTVERYPGVNPFPPERPFYQDVVCQGTDTGREQPEGRVVPSLPCDESMTLMRRGGSRRSLRFQCSPLKCGKVPVA